LTDRERLYRAILGPNGVDPREPEGLVAQLPLSRDEKLSGFFEHVWGQEVRVRILGSGDRLAGIAHFLDWRRIGATRYERGEDEQRYR